MQIFLTHNFDVWGFSIRPAQTCLNPTPQKNVLSVLIPPKTEVVLGGAIISKKEPRKGLTDQEKACYDKGRSAKTSTRNKGKTGFKFIQSRLSCTAGTRRRAHADAESIASKGLESCMKSRSCDKQKLSDNYQVTKRNRMRRRGNFSTVLTMQARKEKKGDLPLSKSTTRKG